MPPFNVRCPRSWLLLGSPPVRAPELPARLPLLVALLGLLGCAQKGSVTFVVTAPADDVLSPFADPRRDQVALFDERTGDAIGQSVSTMSPEGQRLTLGDVPIGDYDVRLSVTGGAQLLGLARAPGVEVPPGATRQVTLRVRKPLAFYSFGEVLGLGGVLPLPNPIMTIDTTLPGGAAESELPPVSFSDCMPASACSSVLAATHDGTLLVVAMQGRVLLVDTGDPYGNNAVVGSAVLATHDLQLAAPIPTAVVVSPDDTGFAVVSDQGVALGAIDRLRGGDTLNTLAIGNARAAAYSPDGKQLSVLTGPAWNEVDCGRLQPATTYVVALADTSTFAAIAVHAPDGATDFAYDTDGQLVFATPCGAGIVHRDGTAALGGQGITRVLVEGGHLIGIPNPVLMRPVSFDPEDPQNTTPTEPFGQILVGGRGTPALFSIPNERVTFTFADTQRPVQVKLDPQRIDAYEVAGSPDSAHVVIASRVRYQANGFRFYQNTDPFDRDTTTCTLDALRDIYRVSEMDLTSGAIGYEVIKGVQDVQDCTISCRFCTVIGLCNTSRSSCGRTDTNFRITEGYKPAGISILMGSR